MLLKLKIFNVLNYKHTTSDILKSRGHHMSHWAGDAKFAMLNLIKWKERI